MIYLASPYSHEDRKVMVLRHNIVCHVTGRLLKEGKIVFSPIAHTYNIANWCDLPETYEFWRNYCIAMLERCDILYVVKIDGWKESIGVQDEIKMAIGLGIPVEYIEE